VLAPLRVAVHFYVATLTLSLSFPAGDWTT
jgi:hypothetical protein